MNPAVAELVQEVDKLVTLPDVFIRINQLSENPDSTVEDIARAVNLDPSFTARLLRLANSSFYGFPAAVDTVPKAVSIIGTLHIRNLALSTSIAKSFEGLPNSLVSMENFWRHSVMCALAARKLARLAGRMDAETMFTAGLLHDIGELVIFSRKTLMARDALLLVQDSADELPLYLAEQQLMGYDHAQVGGELARQWHLPNLLEECIAFHHDITGASKFKREVALIHIANTLAMMAEVQASDLEEVSPMNNDAWQIVGLSAGETIAETLQDVAANLAEAESLFVNTSGERY